MSEARVAFAARWFIPPSEGPGPVNAHATRRAQEGVGGPLFPEIARVRLEDYKVRITWTEVTGHPPSCRVLIEHGDGSVQEWSTVGASRNIIEASWQAIADGVEYGFLERRKATEAA